MPKHFLTAKEAAAAHGVSTESMRRLLQCGRVAGAVKRDRVWVIPVPLLVLPVSVCQHCGVRVQAPGPGWRR